MGKRGPQPRSSHLKAIEGCREDRINRDEAIPSEGDLAPPVPLPDDAMAVWNRLAPDMAAKRVLTPWDLDLFAVFCRATATYNRAAAELESSSLMVKGSQGQKVLTPMLRAVQVTADMMKSTGQRFGLSPGDRAALKVDGDDGRAAGAERLLS